MPEARYFLPDHPELQGEYSRDDLRLLVKSGKLSRSDMVMDDQTGLAHLLGALLASPYYLSPHGEGRRAPEEEEETPVASLVKESAEPFPADVEEAEPEPHEDAEQPPMEFRAATPLRQWESPELEEDHYGVEPDDEDPEDENEALEDEEDEQEGLREPASPDASPVFQAALPREEELIFHGHPSWLSYPKTLLAFGLLSGASYVCQHMHLGLEWWITAAALALLCLAFVALDRLSKEYFITTRRVEVESGLLGRSTKEIRITDIRAIDVTQKGFSAILGVGTLDFFSSAGGQADVCFGNVFRPHRLKQTVRDLQA
jgi:PH (Pleckstrin Homology) domain-containing protein